jgi:ABC-type cobalamin/Fe3+-siderophores transport system ATPase subunit
MTIPTSSDPIILASASFATNSGSTSLNITRGQVVMVAGPNGAGKSALLYSIYRSIGPTRSHYYAGHRQITFNHGWENSSQDIDQLKTSLFQNYDSSNRYKNHWAEDVFKSIIKRLSQEDAEYKSRIVDILESDPSGAQILKRKDPSPVDKLNTVFKAARMAVRFRIGNRGLRAVRNGAEYEIDQLSDGERSALFIACAVLVQDANTVIAIDEPERNLNPSIAAPLLNALITTRNDLGYIFASHDVNLISGGDINTLIYVRDSKITSMKPETREFDAKIVTEFEILDESLKRDLLGTRQKLIFVEGTTNSIDFRIYNTLLPNWKVSPKGGAQDVIDAVRALRRNHELHWVEVAGLIDRDGRPDCEVTALESDGIFALRCPTAENLLFLQKVVEAVAKKLFETEGGIDINSRMLAAETALQEALTAAAPDISARLATWRINRELAEAKVNVADVKSNGKIKANFDFEKITNEASEEISSLVQTTTGFDAVRKIPIKNTLIGSRIVSAIGCDIKRYKNIVFRQLELNSDISELIKGEILQFIPSLEENKSTS